MNTLIDAPQWCDASRVADVWNIRRQSSAQASPDSDSGSNSSDQSTQSGDSTTSSQTSISSQDYWPINVEIDSAEPVGKPTCTSTDRWVAPQVSACHDRSATQAPLHSSQNPRRTSGDGCSPPSLVRQHERKGQFVYHLVDSATCLVETIWPTSAPVLHPGTSTQHGALPLRTFIEETLRRSKTSFSTLQVALFYLVLLKDHVPARDFTMAQLRDCPLERALMCGRRMFLAALICGSKYLQDRNYSARAWSKISGLRVCEINLNERALLAAVKWKLHIPEQTFNRWQDILVNYSHPSMVGSWRRAINHLTPEHIANHRINSQKLDIDIVSNYRGADINTPCRFETIPQVFTGSPSASAASSGRNEVKLNPQPSVAPSVFKLATPSPMSTLCPTPAVGSAGEMLRNSCRPRAMCSAMSMVTSAASARSCMDLPPAAMVPGGASGQFSRRSSLASVASRSNSGDLYCQSVASSPGTMVSDHGSSRSSSVSSTSPRSHNTSPVRRQLSRVATSNAMHRIAETSAAVAAVSYDECTVLESTYFNASPEAMSNVQEVILDEHRPFGEVDYSINVSRDSRKRHRKSVDLVATSLQDQVRLYGRQNLGKDDGAALPHNSSSVAPYWEKPVAKKVCSMRNVAGHTGFVRPEGGPGMWNGILR